MEVDWQPARRCPNADTVRKVSKQQFGSPVGFGRIPVGQVEPVIENGAYPSKATLGENIPITARVIREGHDKVGAHVVLTSPSGKTSRIDMKQIWPQGLDIFRAWFRPDELGEWTFRVEGFADEWHTWHHNAEVKLPLGQDVSLVCMEGQLLLKPAAEAAAKAGDEASALTIRQAIDGLRDDVDPQELADLVNTVKLDEAMTKYSVRKFLTPDDTYRIFVERQRALYGSWYEFFPRSQGAWQDEDGLWHSGTFADCYDQLERIADLGFDVAYITPIHPIGEAFKKGPNNSTEAHPDDPGSPWAIGSPAGGHDTVNPELGTMADFDKFMAKAKSLGLEVALDFALQASPDHPWVKDHPEWFTIRPDGTIAYAENPPKKYQDIYPINFDNDPEGIYNEVLRLVHFWIDHGITIFRVDNPHTKPLQFWERLLKDIRRTNPEVVFLAEAFSRPVVMGNLGKVGFQQSYTYFTWRSTKKELASYLMEVATETADYMRPNFFVNTPDINPFQVRSGAPAAFAIRMILASTMTPSWGIYSGFEFFEHEAPRPDMEVYDRSEKYEFRPRDYNKEPNLNELMRDLNKIRRNHPALQQLRQVSVLETTSDDILAYVKTDGEDQVIVVCSLNPHEAVAGEVIINERAIDLADDELMGVFDELTGRKFVWGRNNYVALDPAHPAHILSVQRAGH